jgi:hypothetical protein
MTKIEKEIYKEARIPNVSQLLGEKRKLESSGLNVGNELGANDSGTSNKLARFAAPE